MGEEKGRKKKGELERGSNERMTRKRRKGRDKCKEFEGEEGRRLKKIVDSEAEKSRRKHDRKRRNRMRLK